MWEPLPVFSLRAVMTFPSIGKRTSLNVGTAVVRVWEPKEPMHTKLLLFLPLFAKKTTLQDYIHPSQTESGFCNPGDRRWNPRDTSELEVMDVEVD